MLTISDDDSRDDLEDGEKGGCFMAGRTPARFGWAGLLGLSILLGMRRRE